ncbi:methylglyoxal synthase [Corallococcus terminator]|uniref:Methylglyoxal synthase n=1 Tax=Corallococcus terminator TaxID=2316733 RepID=A0A3A8JMY9_9BACT|nr:methylglyoxal synthase [Corallococcus terminator]RKG93160.1 methylglyoxal synthase [Corallococcus terminator]
MKTKQNKRKTIALLAHDGKKALLAAFVRDHRSRLRCFNLIGTGNTGLLVQSAGLEITMKLSGPLGGDAQIASEVIAGRCDAVIFLRDPLVSHPHDPDIAMLMRNCDVHNVPLCTNVATAELILKGIR